MTLDQRAQKLREELFPRYDRLNAFWQKVEEQLTEFHIPRPVEFPYRKRRIDWCDPDAGEVRECLGVQRVKGKWRICHASYVDDYRGPPEPDITWVPIIECSAEIRVRAATHVPGLKKAIIESAEKFIPKVDEAIQALAEALGEDGNLAELLAERAKLNGKAKP